MIWISVGLWVRAVHQSIRDDAANLHCIGRTMKETPGPLSQNQKCCFVFPQRQSSCSGFLAVKASVVITSLHCSLALQPAATLHTSTAVKRPCHHFCRGIGYTGCPADKIHAFLAYCHWCSVQGSPDNSFEKVQEYELGVRDEHCRMNYLR